MPCGGWRLATPSASTSSDGSIRGKDNPPAASAGKAAGQAAVTLRWRTVHRPSCLRKTPTTPPSISAWRIGRILDLETLRGDALGFRDIANWIGIIIMTDGGDACNSDSRTMRRRASDMMVAPNGAPDRSQDGWMEFGMWELVSVDALFIAAGTEAKLASGARVGLNS